MKKSLLIAGLFVFSVKFYSQEWIFTGKNSKGDKTYIQNSAIKSNSDNYPKVWSKQICESYAVRKNGKQISVKNAIVLTLHKYDCSEKRRILVSILIYDDKENLITSHNYSEYKNWQYVTPETTGQILLDYVCENL